MQANLALEINKNNLDHMKNLCTLIREGWELIIFDSTAEMKEGVKDNNTKAVLIRKM